MRYLWAVVGLILVSGCAADDVLLMREDVDSTYHLRTIRWSGTFEGGTTTYYIKAFRKDGMIAVCGVRIMEPSGWADDLAETWIDRSRIYVGSRQNTVASGSILGAVDPTDKLTARCVKTKTPAPDNTAFFPIGLVGSAVRIY